MLHVMLIIEQKQRYLKKETNLWIKLSNIISGWASISTTQLSREYPKERPNKSPQISWNIWRQDILRMSNLSTFYNRPFPGFHNSRQLHQRTRPTKPYISTNWREINIPQKASLIARILCSSLFFIVSM